MTVRIVLPNRASSGSGSGGTGGTNTGTVIPPLAYHHRQGVSSATWTIVHNLGFYPNVTCMDSSGSVVEGEITHSSAIQLTVTFSAPFSGNAYLS